MNAMKPVKVYSCAKRFQADMLIEALNEEGIPAYSQTDGSGEYMEIYMGTSLFGEDIYVDESDAARAEEIIKGMTLPADDTQQTAESDEPAAVSEGNRMSAAKIICLIGSVKNFVALVKNGSFLVRITDMTILIEKEFIYGSSKRPNPTDYYRKQHYQCG